MSDQPDKPEDGDAAPGEPSTSEPLLSADDVHLPEPDVSPEAVEPELSTPADQLRLDEPTLGAAEISENSAQATSLDEVAAEARSVAREAEEAGTLATGARTGDDPAEAAAPAGTAPAGGTAGDVAEQQDEADLPGPVEAADETEVAGPVGRVDSHDSVEAPDPAGAPEAPAPKENDGGQSDTPPGLASLAASGSEPAWTGQEQDQSRWDALFDAGRHSAATGLPVAAESTREPAADPADLPAGLPAEPAAAPESAAPESAAKGAEASAAARKATETADAAPETPPAAPDAAPETPWAQPFPVQGPQTPGSPVPPVGGPYGLPPAGTEQASPTRIRARAADRSVSGSNRKKLLILGAAGLLLLALLIFAIVSIVNALRGDDTGRGATPGSTPGADGIIAENISPLELEAGACILGFDAANVSADVTTVTCTTPHNAQLLATTSLPEDADFPGEAALNASGDELCNSVPIDEDAAAGYSGLTLTQVTPTSGTWAEGDRRIDCFVVSDEGNVITDTLLAE